MRAVIKIEEAPAFGREHEACTNSSVAPFEQALYYSAAPPTYPPRLLLFAACHSCIPLLHIHAVISNRMYPVWSAHRRDPVGLPLCLSSQWKPECCHSALPPLLAVSEAPVLALGVASGSRLEDPANRQETMWPTTSRC